MKTITVPSELAERIERLHCNGAEGYQMELENMLDSLSYLYSLIDLREDDESTDTINAMGVIVEHYALIKSAYQEDMELNADSSTI